jgi:hypothetical protein
MSLSLHYTAAQKAISPRSAYTTPILTCLIISTTITTTTTTTTKTTTTTTTTTAIIKHPLLQTF